MVLIPDKCLAWETVKFVSDDANLNGKPLTSVNLNEFTYELDLSGSTSDLEFKFNVSDGCGDIGWYDSSCKEISDFDGNTQYWCANRTTSGQNEKFVLKHSGSDYKKYKLTLTWEKTGDDGKQYWRLTVQGVGETISGIDPNAYYFVITKAGEEDRWLKMAPSRKRGGGEVLSDRWSFNIQNFMVDKYKDADGLRYYIIKGDKSRKYTPHSNNNDYELGLKNNTQETNNNCGNVKAYELYEDTQNENNCTFKLDNTNNSYNGVSYTWLFDSQAYNLEILVNKTRMGQTDDPAEGYYLVGNFLGESATDAIEPQKTDNRRSMNKYFYKNGLAYPAATAGITEAEADSVVYRITVAKPKGQSTWGNLYLVVFRKKM